MGLDPIVFIVDDDRAMRDSLALLVRSAGLTARTYPSAEAFLETRDANRPGCLVIDVRMKGMSGLDLQEALVAKEIDLPIIIVSGHVDVPLTARAMRLGAVDVIEKPYDPRFLKRRIAEAIAMDVQRRQEQDR